MARFVKKDWGWYFDLYRSEKKCWKVLYFNGKKSLSMQRHSMRHEKWYFIFGNGMMDLGTKDISPIRLKAGFIVWCTGIFGRGTKSLLIPKRTWHQFHAGRKTLVIEHQWGELVQEGDIQRDTGGNND